MSISGVAKATAAAAAGSPVPSLSFSSVVSPDSMAAACLACSERVKREGLGASDGNDCHVSSNSFS